MARRRKRPISPEDQALWSQVTATAVPLSGRVQSSRSLTRMPDPAEQTARVEMPEPFRTTPVQEPVRKARVTAPVSVDWAPDPLAALSRAGLDRKRTTRLRQGKLEPDASIDLHGMTLDSAHRALLNFVRDAVRRQHRLLLVVTGRGRQTKAEPWEMSKDTGGVIRRNLPIWLGQMHMQDAILDIRPASRRHGGHGAFYISLRRRR